MDTKFTTEEEMLRLIAVALEDSPVEASWYLNLTKQSVCLYEHEYFRGMSDYEDYDDFDDCMECYDDLDLDEDSDGGFDRPDWEKELIEEARSSELVEITALSSSKVFKIMESFAFEQDKKAEKTILDALQQRKPFAHFQAAIDKLGLRQEWYKYKDVAYLEQAKDWALFNDIVFENGKACQVLEEEEDED